MLLQGLVVDNNVIKINNNKVIKERRSLFITVQNVISASARPKGKTKNSNP